MEKERTKKAISENDTKTVNEHVCWVGSRDNGGKVLNNISDQLLD